MDVASNTLPTADLWPDLAAFWRSLPAPERRLRLKALARGARAAWLEKLDLRDVPLSAWALHADATEGWSARLPPGLTSSLNRPLPPSGLRRALADWLNETRDVVRPTEQYRFLRHFLLELDAEAVRYQARTIAQLADEDRRKDVSDSYGEYVGDAAPLPRDVILGMGPDRVPRRPEDLLADIEAAARAPSATVIKAGRSISVTRASLWGREVIVKRFEIAPGWPSWRYRGRPSRARRAWAAGRLLQSRGIATPEPLGYVEVRRGGTPVVSYAVAEFVAGADTAFRWIRRRYRGLSEGQRAGVARELRAALLALYDAGIYHGDTKLTNVLICERDAGRQWLWTDLECLDAGRRLTRRRLLRNLIQLNGSLRHWVPEGERRAFLAALALRYPWLAKPAVAARIATRSRTRLQRERDGRTPPDGRRGP